MPMEPFPRISGRLGSPILLNITFFKAGIPTDPFAIRNVKIYRSAIKEEFLVAEIPFPAPDDPLYPAPATKPLEDLDGSGGTLEEAPGKFELIFDVPSTGIPVPDIFFDVWQFIAEEPTDTDFDIDDEDNWSSCCNEFWLFEDDGFFCDTGLCVISLGFEALDLKLRKPECRTIEVGVMPLPLYDFDSIKINSILPRLTATISIFSESGCEILVEDAPMTIGLRQGSYRSNPFAFQRKIDTSQFLSGTYRYRVTVMLPNGETRVSEDFFLSISA